MFTQIAIWIAVFVMNAFQSARVLPIFNQLIYVSILGCYKCTYYFGALWPLPGLNKGLKVPKMGVPTNLLWNVYF